MIDARLTLSEALAELGSAVERTLATDDLAHVVVPGGRSPERLFAALRTGGTVDARWRFHLADERCVPPDDPRRNAPAVARALGLGTHERSDGRTAASGPATLDGPPALDDDAEAARRYAAGLASVGRFAAVVLGVGTDGHVASVFPGDPSAAAPGVADALVVDAPEAGAPRRITLSVPRLSRTRLVLLVVDGPGKDTAVEAVVTGADVPANVVGGERRVLVDLRG
jgi:6-phosphogluconolactonase